MKDEALKLALKALRMADELCRGHGVDFKEYGLEFDRDIQVKYKDAITAIKEALAQPAQEPWRESASDYERGVIDGRQKQAQSSVDKAVNRMAQRPWVGLTKDDTLEIAERLGLADVAWLDLMMAIETKLKERNA
jgi:hypothetical protein